MAPLLHVTHRHGIYLPEADLWLDPHHGVERAFISHAHSDHVARHGMSFCSAETAALMRARYSIKNGLRAMPFREALEWEGWTLRLLPAGHIFGSAMLHLTRQSDGATLLYTGDYKLRQGLSSERCELAPADTLIMETTFGLPLYQFPPVQEIIAGLVKFCRETLEDGGIPVLLGYSLGKAQEILCALSSAGFPLMLHKAVFEMTEAMRPLGLELPPCALFDTERAAGHVLVFPPSNAKSLALRKLKVCRSAMLSGWAMQPGARYRYQVDEAFPLSDHADYPELLETVETVKPRRVYLVHGYTREFAADLRARGWEAWSLERDDQLELGLSTERTAKSHTAPEPDPVSEETTGFPHWATVCARTAEESSRLKKTAHLSAYLRSLDDDDLVRAARYCAGLTGDPSAGEPPLNTGWAILRRALQELSGLTDSEYRALSRSQADAGRTAYLVLQRSTLEPQPFALSEVEALFVFLRRADGPAQRVAALRQRFAALSAHAGAWLVRLLTGDLRMGSKEGLIEEAIAHAFSQNADAVREAAMLTGDIGRAALLAKKGTLHTAQPRAFVPLKVMLASPEETAAGIWKRMTEDGNGPVWLEDKYDGIRAQLHHAAGRAEVYSRDLKPLGEQFPELLRAALTLPAGVILDGEIIAFAEDKRLSFFDLQKRLGRRGEADLFLPSDISVRYIVFDLLWQNGTPLLDQPLSERRRMLESLALPADFSLIAVQHAAGAEEIEAAFLAARRRGNEGLIIKAPGSPYTPGRRGKSWLKLKKAFATLDVVVVKAEQGHGKRSHVLSDYTFAVRDAAGAHRIIGKAYSGLTDAEIEELTAHFTAHTLSENGRVRTVVPDTVLEIAFDSIQPSPRHDSGLALRFPRIKAIRRDKTPDEIDTLDYARRLAGV